MLPALTGKLLKQATGSLAALSQCQQLRFFNVHEYQASSV